MLFCLEQFAILLEIDEYGHRSYTKLEEAEHIYRHQALGAGQPWVAAHVRAATRTVERYKKTSKGEQVWKPTEHCVSGKDGSSTVCERLVPWMRKALGTTLPKEFVDASQGVWVETMVY